MRRLLIIILILFSLTGCNSKKRKTDQIKSGDVPIPESLYEVISDSLKGFYIPTKEDYDPKLLSEIKEIPHPFFCKNDFDGNGEIDYGLLLKSQDNTLNFFIFNSINKKFHIINMGRISLGITDNGLATVISNVQKGDWSSFDTTISVPYGGISLKLLEESKTRSYYWDGKKYERFYTD